MKRRCPDLKFTHEQMSLKMLDYMIDDNNIDIEQDHVQFVKDLIMASEHAKSSKGNERERVLYVVTEIYRDKKKREHNYDVTGTNS